MDFLDRPNLEKPHKPPTSQAKPGAKPEGIPRHYRVKLDPKLAKVCKTYQTCTP